MPANPGNFSRRRRVALILSLGLLTGLGPFTIDLYLPAFPSLTKELTLAPGQVQLTLAATIGGFAVGQLLVGPMSDRLGRRWPLVAMSALHVGATMAVALVPNLAVLAAVRLIQGFAAAGGAVVALAMARDMFNGAALLRMLSRLALISGLAPILAPLIGSWLVTFTNWRGVFWWLAGYSLLVLLLAALVLTETHVPANRIVGSWRNQATSYRQVFADRTFVGALLVLMFSFAGLFAYVSSVSTVFQGGYGLSPQAFGGVFATASVGVFLGVQVGSRVGARFGSPVLLMVGTAGLVLAAAWLLVTELAVDSPVALVPPIFCYTFSYGTVAPNSNVTALARHQAHAGTAASILGAGTMTAGAIAALLVGSLPLYDATAMAGTMLGSGLLASLSLWLVLRPRQLRLPTD